MRFWRRSGKPALRFKGQKPEADLSPPSLQVKYYIFGDEEPALGVQAQRRDSSNYWIGMARSSLSGH